jgi:hypothetical protein
MQLEDFKFDFFLEDSYVVQYPGPLAFQYAKISKDNSGMRLNQDGPVS